MDALGHGADTIGWMALKEAAPTVAAGLAPIVAALPVIDDAADEYDGAGAIGRHCRARKTFVSKIYETRLAAADRLEALTAATIEIAKDAATAAGKATTETGATTIVMRVKVGPGLVSSAAGAAACPRPNAPHVPSRAAFHPLTQWTTI